MNHAFLYAALGACVLGPSSTAQAPVAATSAVSAESVVRIRYATFDPLQGEPAISTIFRSSDNEALWIVQFAGRPTEDGRQQVSGLGAEIHGYLPDHSYVVRMSAERAQQVRDLAVVRAVTAYHPAFRLDPALLAQVEQGDALGSRRYNVVTVDKHQDKPALGAAVLAMGGIVVSEEEGSILFSVILDDAQLLQALRLPQVLWIDEWTAPENDVDNARTQAGANYVEAQGGFTGLGLNVHIYEGIDAAHPAFSGPVTNVLSGGASSGHGTNTAGIVFGDGTGNAAFRGFAPDTGKFYTNYGSVSGSRYSVVDELVNNRDVSHTTASWGGARTTSYTSVSADTDDIIFDHDLAWTQSQSNAGNTMSRPQAWAKNVFSIGGFAHYNNSSSGDDSWQGGGGSTGPASDGRMKPTLAAYYDSIGTTSQGGGYTTGFGGTSGATPIVAGNNILAIDMFTTEIAPGTGIGLFGNALRNPGGSKHSNRPHFTTLKALQVANSSQYSFNPTSTDNRREHVGFGYPNLQRMYDNRSKMFIVDETDVLVQGGVTRWDITVAPGETELRIALNWADPAANPSSAQHLINNLSLTAVSPTGTTYWGNNGLMQGTTSPAGGSEDNLNSLEVIVIPTPQAGVWHIDVTATQIVQDGHAETPAVDADYGLVVSGGTGQGGNPVIIAQFSEYGAGCPGSQFNFNYCVSLNPTGGTLVGTPQPEEYSYLVSSAAMQQVLSFDIFSRSTTGSTETVPAHIYLQGSFGPQLTPIASTTVQIGPTDGFYTATFASPVTVPGLFYIAVDSSAGTVVPARLLSGGAGASFVRLPGAPTWSVIGMPASWRVTCASSTQYVTPNLSHAGLPQLNSSYSVELSDALGSSAAILATGFSDTSYSGGALPSPLPNAPGCDLLASPDDVRISVTNASGVSFSLFTVPNDPALSGMELFHQWLVLDPTVNTLGIVTSDAGKARVGI